MGSKDIIRAKVMEMVVQRHTTLRQAAAGHSGQSRDAAQVADCGSVVADETELAHLPARA